MKNFTASKGAGALQSSWQAPGMPGAGVAPPLYTAGSGYTSSSATVGAIPLTNATVRNSLAKLSANCNVQGSLLLLDRLWACSGMGFAAGTYTVTTPGSLPARITDDGINAQLFVEQYVVAGVATGSLTANYLESTTGTAKAGVITTVVSAPVTGQLQKVPLAVGSKGIRSLTSVVTSNTWTSGTFGMCILKQLASIPINSNNFNTLLDWAQLALEQVPDDACLMLAWQSVSATAISTFGDIVIIDTAITSVDDIAIALGS